jgi:hypothetical protein
MDKRRKKCAPPILERRISTNRAPNAADGPVPENFTVLLNNSAKLLEQQQTKIDKLGYQLLEAQNMIDSMRRRHEMVLKKRDQEIELLRCTIEKSKEFLD